MKKIAIVGIYPPPLGGISVHIKRIKELLDKNSYVCRVYNEGIYENVNKKIYKLNSYRSFVLQSFKLDVDIIHFHCTTADVRSMLWLFKKLNKNKKIILTIHGISLKDQLKNSNFLTKYFLIKSLKEIDNIIVVNEEYKEFLNNYNVKKEKIKFIQPFIKPICGISEFKSLNKDLKNFLIEDNDFKIISNGSIKFYNNEELYGFDLLIESVYKLKSEGYNVKLLLTILSVDFQNEKEKKYYLQLKENVRNLQMEKNIMFYEVNNTELYPLLEKSNLFIRATNTDGDPISLKEAISLKVPVIASNSSVRPNCCILFENRNVEDLYNKIKQVMLNYNDIKNKCNEIFLQDASEEILSFYDNL